MERARKEQRKAERGELKTELDHEDPIISTSDNKKETIPEQPAATPVAPASIHNEGIIRVAHSMTHDVSHSEPVRICR